MALDINGIRYKYNNGGYHCDMAIPDKVSLDHVFDEDLSVKRNRELAQEHNDRVDRMRQEKFKIQHELNEQLTNDVVEYIMAYYDLTKQQAKMVESFVYTEKHSYMGDYFSYIDTVSDFVFMLLEPKEEKDD